MMGCKLKNSFYTTVLFISLMGFHAGLIGQQSLQKYKLPQIIDPVMPMLTNRLVDSLSPGHYHLKNEIDRKNSLRLFKTEIIGDSIYCSTADESFLPRLFAEPGKDWVLLIHGDSKAPVDAAVRGLEIQNTHDVKVITFSWPSRMDTRDGLKNFSNSRQNVEAGLPHLRELFLMLKRYRSSYIWPKENKLSLIMHSLGNFYLELAVKEQMLEGIDSLFDNIIINAAAVEQEGHAGWVGKLRIARRIYITLNKGDFNLKGARTFTRAGIQLGAVVEPPLAVNADYIHFSDAVGFKLPTWLSHTYFVGEIPAGSDNIRAFYRTIFHGGEAELNNQAMFRIRDDAKGYDIIY